MKTPKSASSSKKTNKKTPKVTTPKPLKVVDPSPMIIAPLSSSIELKKSDPPSSSTMHDGSKRQNISTKKGLSSRLTKKVKTVDPNSPEEIAKEMSVGFGLNKYWYDTTPFPQLDAIIKNQSWETLMTDFCCNLLYPNLMREFISNFSIDNGVCSSFVKEIKIEFNCVMLGEWFEVPAVGFDTYHVGTKIVFSGIYKKNMLKFLRINEKRGRISHNTLSPLHKLLYYIA